MGPGRRGPGGPCLALRIAGLLVISLLVVEASAAEGRRAAKKRVVGSRVLQQEVDLQTEPVTEPIISAEDLRLLDQVTNGPVKQLLTKLLQQVRA